MTSLDNCQILIETPDHISSLVFSAFLDWHNFACVSTSQEEISTWEAFFIFCGMPCSREKPF